MCKLVTLITFKIQSNGCFTRLLIRLNIKPFSIAFLDHEPTGAELDNRTYEDEHLTDTVFVPHLLTGVAIGTFQADYPLCEVDFLHIQRNDSSLAAWAFNAVFATGGYLLSIVPKWLGELAGKPEQVSKGEWTVLAVAVGITVSLYALSPFVPSQKKKTMKKISEHFRSAPRSRQAIRRET
jgi:hypothetical protein